MPAALLPLPSALALCMNAQGYVPAAAQVALLQTCGAMAVASAAQTLAEDVRRACTGADARPPPRRSRRGRRARCTRDGPGVSRPADVEPASDVNDDCLSIPVCSDRVALADGEEWRALDGVDLVDELRLRLLSCVLQCGER